MSGLEFTRNQKLALIAIAGLIAIGVSIKLARNASSPVYSGVTVREASSDGTNVTAADSDSTRSSDPNAGKVTFQIAGAVIAPNVYTLPRGSRIVDAIKAAGGTKIGANTESLNLAAKIEDGSKILIPTDQQQSSQQPTVTTASSTPATPDHVKISIIPTKSGAKSSSAASAGGKLRNPGDGVVHINTADIAELQRLPGVGPSTAQKIVDYRTQVGRFTSADQLDDVKGIGPAKLAKMRPFISL